MQTAQDGAGNGAAPPAASGSPQATGTDALPSPQPRLGIGNGRSNGTPAPQPVADRGDVDDYSDDSEPSPWADNWRQSLAKGDAARLAALERYADPTALADALFNARGRLMRGAQAPTLPDDATDAEIKEFRKAHGIPEAAKDYGLAWPEGTQPSEADNLGLNAFAEFMHAKHVPPSAVKAAFEYYTSAQAQARQEHAEAVHEANLQAVAELRDAYKGREFKRNMTIAEEFLAKHYEGSERELDLVLQAQLPNGVQVKNYAPFIKGLVAMARSYADEEALVGGDGAGGGKSIDGEYNELVSKSATARLSNDEHKRLTELAEARQSRLEKQGRRQS